MQVILLSIVIFLLMAAILTIIISAKYLQKQINLLAKTIFDSIYETNKGEFAKEFNQVLEIFLTVEEPIEEKKSKDKSKTTIKNKEKTNG